MRHHATPEILWGSSHFYMTLNTPRRLLFFVHGLNGRNTATWINFPGLLLDDPRHASDDLLFYGYDSLFQSGTASAGELYQNCDELISHPERYPLISKEHDRAADFRYDNIVFIGHSLGAPIVRMMLLMAHAQNRQWLKDVVVTFYAPATAGARAEELLRFIAAQGNWLNWIALLFNLRCPVIEDLKIGSDFLTHIRDETLRLMTRLPNLRSARTVFGTLEYIITIKPPLLPFDEPYDYITGHTHRTVCKPIDTGDHRYKALVDTLEQL